MAALWKNNFVTGRERGRESGQALVEFSLIASMMIIMVLGVIDLSRAIYDKEVLSDLSRTGSNLASRGPCSTLDSCLTTAANAVITQPSALNMAANGQVIVTAVQANSTGTANTITDQVSQGGNLGSSKIGAVGSPANLPATALSHSAGKPDSLRDGSLLYIYTDNAAGEVYDHRFSIDVV